MKNVNLYKGNEVITFTQSFEHGNVIVTGDGLHEVSMTVDSANELYKGKLSLGWSIEKPNFAPKKPQTREEALTAKYGDKEARTEYVLARNHFTRVVVDSLVEWQKNHRRLTYKEYNDQKKKGVAVMMKSWEESGRPSLA